PAWCVELERHQFAAIPVDPAGIADGWWPEFLREVDFRVVALEAVGRPSEQPASAKRSHVIGLHADLDEAAAITVPRLADAKHATARCLDDALDLVPIDAGG